MKLKLLSLILTFTISISYAQLKPVTITFKNGEKLRGIGKRKVTLLSLKLMKIQKHKNLNFQN